jgi:hypothetical protein
LARTTTSDKDRKRLVRTLICDITLLPELDRSEVRIGIRWHTAHATNSAWTGRCRPGRASAAPHPRSR